MIATLICSHIHPSIFQFSSIYKECHLFADLAVTFEKVANENTSPAPRIILIFEKYIATLCIMSDYFSGAEV